MDWFHAECFEEDVKYEGPFTCAKCRRIPDELCAIRKMLEGSKSAVNSGNSEPVTVSECDLETSKDETVTQVYSYNAPVFNSFDPLSDLLDNDVTTTHEDEDSSYIIFDESTLSSSSSSEPVTPPSNQEAWQQICRTKISKDKPVSSKNSKADYKVSVISDSMLAKVDIRRTKELCKEANSDLIFLSEGADIGSTIRCIQGDSVPRDQPVIIHTGTNHVEREGLVTTMHRLDRLEYNLRFHKYQSVALSSIVYRRTDSLYMHEKIKALNNAILTICTRNGWTYVDNDNLDVSCLQHGDRVHPNRYGTERLAYNIAGAVKKLVSGLKKISH